MSISPDSAPVCLVTGAAGFVGGHLTQRLLTLGCKVVGVDNFFSGKPENLLSFNSDPNFWFFERSIAEPDLLPRIQRQVGHLSLVFHLAAIVSVPYSLQHSEECLAINQGATLNLLEQSRRLGVDAFVFAGSAAEYGTETRLPLVETYADSDTRRLSPYGESKFAASTAVARQQHRPRGVALRCFNIYGPRQDPSSPYSGVISRFLERAGAGQPLTIFGDGLQTRDFIYVTDVVEAYLAAAGIGKAPLPPAGVYNVGTGIRTSVLELARLIERLTGRRESITFAPERAGDIRHSLADIGALAQAARWRPRVSLAQGLECTIDWLCGREVLHASDSAEG